MTSSALEKPRNVKQASGFDLSALTHPIFKNARIVTDEPADEVIVRRRMYQPGERNFALAPRCVENGWSVYPQTRDGVRRPALIDGHSIRISEYREKLPTAAEVAYWLAKAATDNVALQLGPASGHTFAIDVDIDNEADAHWVIGLANRILGFTPFQRIGRVPRLVLIYRRDPSKPMRSRALKIAGTSDAIEILGDGKSVTIFGAHHSTGDYFRWPDIRTPATARPDAAPLVTAEQLEAFLDAVDHYKELAGYRQKAVSHFRSEPVDFDGTVVSPRNRMDVGTWERNGLGKLIIDGRQAWLFSRALSYVRLNADSVRTDEGSAAVYQRYLAEALRYVARSGRWSADAAIETECRSIWGRTRENLLSDRIRAQAVTINADGSREVAAKGGVLAIAGDLGSAAGWVPPAGSKDRRASPRRVVEKVDDDHKPNADRAAKVALLDSVSREAVERRVAAEVAGAIDSFLHSLWDNADRIAASLSEGKPLPDALREIGALIAPTGAGKTSTLVRRFVEIRQQRGPLPFAMAVFLPGHQNAREASEIAMGAGASDVWAEVDEAARGAKVLHYKGKAAAGCMRLEELVALQKAGISTANLCRSTVTDPITKEKSESLCRHYHECPAIAQRKLADQADIIILPHAYITNPLPKEVAARIGAIVIDERFWPELVSNTTMPLDVLGKPRKAPYQTATDKRDGITPNDHLLGHHRACKIATQAILSGACPAHTLACWSTTEALSKKTVTGLDVVRSAKTVCSRAKTSSLEVRPNMTAAEVGDLLARPEGDHLMVEWRFWSMIEQTILDYRSGKKKPDDREHRIKILRTQRKGKAGITETDHQIGISWRSSPLLANRPTFLLDASAHPRILGKIFGGRPVKIHRVEAPLHLRTIVVAENIYDQKMIPAAPGNLTRDDQARAADVLSKARFMTAHVAAMYPTERVLAASTLAGVKAIQNEWRQPDNVDFCYFGNLRGLDLYKEHAVAISFGRMELPVDVLDGLVAAFSYDDETPEPAWNANGTGWVGNQRLRAPEGERRLMRRDGAYVTLRDSIYPEGYDWHNIVRAQWREEELRQFAGRLRPVYRQGEAPLWIVCATCVPDDIVVDDVLTLDQITKGAGLGEAVRRGQGVMDHHMVGLDMGVTPAGRGSLTDHVLKAGGRLTEGYAKVMVWSDGNPSPRKVRVAAWVPSVWDAIYATERQIGRDLDRIEIVEIAPEVNTLARVPEPSKLDRAMSRLPNAATATRAELLQERADAEALRRESTLEALKSAGVDQVDWLAIRMPGVAAAMPLHVAMILASYPPPGEAEAEVAEPEPPPRALAA